jgi:hypothetical protein
MKSTTSAIARMIKFRPLTTLSKLEIKSFVTHGNLLNSLPGGGYARCGEPSRVIPDFAIVGVPLSIGLGSNSRGECPDRPGHGHTFRAWTVDCLLGGSGCIGSVGLSVRAARKSASPTDLASSGCPIVSSDMTPDAVSIRRLGEAPSIPRGTECELSRTGHPVEIPRACLAPGSRTTFFAASSPGTWEQPERLPP